MDRSILFMAEYPNQETAKEGMSQRMIAVDRQFADDKRAYLFVSHRLYAKKEQKEIFPGVIQYRCNLFVHFFFILRLFRSSKLIYFHSIQNALPILPILLILTQSKYILDVHGIVPEEHLLAGYASKSKLYALTERVLFKRLFLAISVTESMANHFKKKYLGLNYKNLIYPIMPNNIQNGVNQQPIEESDMINVVYSGNLQKWQNVDLMLDIIADNLSPKITYTLLTGSPEEMKAKAASKGLDEKKNVFIYSVAPDELVGYYNRANYGFILRDDIPVNNVACPTKLVEYMYYGIVPIVKSPNIGDFGAYGFEYLKVNDFSLNALKAVKSKKNKSIISEMLVNSQETDIREYLVSLEQL